MERRISPAMAAGMLVAVIGLVPLFKALGSGAESSPPSTPATSTTAAVTPRNIETLDPRVSRVLYAYGAAEAVGPGTNSGLPDAIASVLSRYGATLTVPESERP